MRNTKMIEVRLLECDLDFVVLVVLMQFDFDFVDEVENVLDNRLLLRSQITVHFIDSQASVSINLSSNTFA